MNKRYYKEWLYYAAAGLCVVFCFALIADSAVIKTHIVQAIDRCINIIVPSLFAFMAVSDLLIKSGLYNYVSKPFTPFSKYILGMPAQLFFVFLMGNLAGYPMGVKLLSDLVRSGKISAKTAEIMSCFCCCGGPAFYAGTVGLGIFGSVKIGMGVFTSIVLANVMTAAIACRIWKPKLENSDVSVRLDSQLLTDSVVNSGKSLFTICGMIVFFSAFMSVLEYFGAFSFLADLFSLDKNAVALLRSFFEITSVTEISSISFGSMPAITALCSFGGLCVVMQIAAVNAKTFSLKRFYLTRPVNAVLSALIFEFIKKYFLPEAIETVYSNSKYLVNINNFVPSICLILMILLLMYKKRLVFSRQM